MSVEKLQELCDRANYIVFFGGAGVSTESGIPDFRSVDGIYRMKYAYPPETILSHEFFVNHTREFFDFYFEKMLYSGAKPNACHLKLAEMERSGKLKAVITQNIDGLHQAAGSREVLELHGSVYRNYCTECGKFYSLEELKKNYRCACGGIVKPDVVLYGENLSDDTLMRATAHLRRADLVIVGGTSLTVYPASGLLYYTSAPVVLVNKGATEFDSRAELVINSPIGQVFSQLKV